MSGSWAIELSDDCTLHPTNLSRKATEQEIKGIVTAVNNYDKMKEAIEVQLQIIESLVSGKRVVNLDESIAYYKNLLKQLETK